MAQKEILSNQPSLNPPSNPYLKGLMGSIVARVFAVCMVLLILPLSIHTFILYKEEYQTGVKELVFNLEFAGKFSKNIIDEKVQDTLADIKTISSLSESLSPQKLSEIAQQHGYSSLFYQNSTAQQVVSLKGEKIFIEVATPTAGMTLIATLDAEALLKKFLGYLSFELPLNLAFLDLQDHPLVGTDLTIFKNPFVIFNTEDLAAIRSGSYPQLIKKLDHLPSEGRIGIKIPMGGGAFTLLATAPKKDLYQEIGQKFFFHVVKLAVLFAVFGGLGVFLLTRKIAEPLRDLALTMQAVSAGDFSARYHPNLIGFEINQLGKHFNEMVGTLQENIQEAKKQRVAKELLEQELLIGRNIQQSILPQKMPKIPHLDIASGFVPAKEVSGDFFDIYLRSDNKLILTVADASGKGISACLYSLGVRSMLRSFEFSLNSLPEILKKTNELFTLDTGDSGMFVTLWIGILDLSTHSLEYASCGHPPALLHTQGVLEELPSSGVSLGVTPEMTLDIQHRSLKPGDTLLVYTDGIIEASSPQGKLFGLEGIKNHLKIDPPKNPSSCISGLTHAVEKFTAGADMADDLTLLCVKIV